MFLSDIDIRKQIKAKKIKISPFEPKQLSGVTYDLRLHKHFRLYNKTKDVTHIDVREKFEVTQLTDEGFGGSIVIHPGEFLLGATNEKIELPNNILGLLEGRSSLARIGLVVHATASLVQPGFKGFLTLEMSNMSNLPIKLYVGMRIAKIAFAQTTTPVKDQYGSVKLKSKYSGQKPPTSSRIWKDFD